MCGCVTLLSVSCMSMKLAQKLGFRNCTRLLMMYKSPAKSAFWNKPFFFSHLLQCQHDNIVCSYQCDEYSWVVWSIVCRTPCWTRSKKCAVGRCELGTNKQFSTVRLQTSESSPTVSISSFLNWWSSEHGGDTLCNSQYRSTHVCAWCHCWNSISFL